MPCIVKVFQGLMSESPPHVRSICKVWVHFLLAELTEQQRCSLLWPQVLSI